jgi:hypothetical protein
MRSPLFFLLCLIAASIVPGFVHASETVKVDAKVHFRLLPHTMNVEMRWKRYKKPKEFLSYQIIRSSSVSSTDPLAGEFVASTTNRYSTNYEDHPPANGVWYYRLCVETKTLGTICSKATSADVKGIKTPIVTEPTVSDAATGPLVIQPPVGELDLTVAMSSSSIAFSWSPLLSATTTFSNYKIVRSQTIVEPSYPRDGYLAHIPDVGITHAADTDILFGTIHYRVCAVDLAEHLWCGNVVTVVR